MRHQHLPYLFRCCIHVNTSERTRAHIPNPSIHANHDGGSRERARKVSYRSDQHTRSF